jgi:hypothetical protein
MNNLLGIGSRIFHVEHGNGVVIGYTSKHYSVCFIDHGVKEIPLDTDMLEVLDAIDTPKGLVALGEVERAFMNVLRKWVDFPEVVPIAEKWKDGKIIIKPSNPDLAPKEVPIDQLFNKIILIRDRLRVLEQKINSTKQLDDADKIELQQYITRCYGSLTTFNVLFKDKDDQFVGEKGGK